MVSITLGKETYEIEKAKLKLWLQLSSIHDQITSAVEQKDFDKLSSSIILYVTTALDASDIDNLPWEEVTDALISIINLNALDFEIPLLLSRPEDNNKVPWDYEGRNWYFWSHSIAKEFGWSLEYIADLEIEDAIKLLQEVLVNKQLEKEWEWMLSEKSVSWDAATKKGKYNELPRPDWMKISVSRTPKKIIQIPEHLMPVGTIIRAKH